MAAIQRQKESAQWDREDGRYIPNAATWLSQGRWEDELPRRLGDSQEVSGVLGEAELENIRRVLDEEL